MSVNGIELKEGQRWTTASYGEVIISEDGISDKYPWLCRSDESFFSITEDGKYWDDDLHTILRECIYNPTDQVQKKFNPKPGDRIICNNGEEFICCTKETLKRYLGFSLCPHEEILGYSISTASWQDWNDVGFAWGSDDCEYNIREVIPQQNEEDMKEEQEPKYTADEVFYAIKEYCGKDASPIGCELEIKTLLKKFDEDPEYKDYLRLKSKFE